jgi:hypothetical protein
MEKNKKHENCCCDDDHGHKEPGVMTGVIYGMIPHSFCILFVICSVLGVTVASQFLRQFMLLPYFIPLLIGVSLVFATISSTIYLKKTGNLSLKGVSRKKNYLMILFGSIILVNLLFFEYVMPAIGNINTPIKGTEKNIEKVVEQDISKENICSDGTACPVDELPSMDKNGENTTIGNFLKTDEKILDIQVSLPCEGHAFLVKDDLGKIEGVTGVTFRSPNFFTISYDSSIISDKDILGIDIFKEYKAAIR